MHKGTLYLYRLLRCRPARVVAKRNVRDGFAWSESFGITVDVQPAEQDTDAKRYATVDKLGPPGSALLGGTIETMPRIEASRCVLP